MRSLVTGGAGFIGSHPVDRLLPRAMTLLLTTVNRALKPNISGNAFEFEEIDVCRHEKILPSFEGTIGFFIWQLLRTSFHQSNDR